MSTDILQQVSRLARLARRSDIAEHSFENYHALGLDYLCLHRRFGFTVKAYFFDPDRMEHNECGWLVWPHTHRYEFTHYTVAGLIRHHRFTLSPAAERMWLHAYEADDRSSRPVVEVTCSEHVEELAPGTHFTLRTDEFHTLSIPGQRSIAVQLQYEDRHERSALLAPTKDVHCDDPRLYRPLTRWDELRDELLHALSSFTPEGR